MKRPLVISLLALLSITHSTSKNTYEMRRIIEFYVDHGTFESNLNRSVHSSLYNLKVFINKKFRHLRRIRCSFEGTLTVFETSASTEKMRGTCEHPLMLKFDNEVMRGRYGNVRVNEAGRLFYKIESEFNLLSTPTSEVERMLKEASIFYRDPRFEELEIRISVKDLRLVHQTIVHELLGNLKVSFRSAVPGMRRRRVRQRKLLDISPRSDSDKILESYVNDNGGNNQEEKVDKKILNKSGNSLNSKLV